MTLRTPVAAAAAALLLFTGCTAEPALDPVVEPTPNPTSLTQLAAQKKAAEIEDCPTSNADAAPVTNGLPDVVLACLGGGREVHLAGLRGRPMMINIWAQWCPPCREEAPAISEVAMLNTSELTILGIDYADPRPDDALLFAELSAWRFPQLVDADKQLQSPLQIKGPPQTFFVRADGTIAYRHSGPFRSADQIRQVAEKYLGVTL